MMKLALKPDESLDPENSESESACSPTEVSFRAEGVAGGVIGRDEWFEKAKLGMSRFTNRVQSWWYLLSPR